MYSPKKVCMFVIACVMLHNIRRGLRLQEDEDYLEDDMEDTDDILMEEPLVMHLPLRQQLVDILGN